MVNLWSGFFYLVGQEKCYQGISLLSISYKILSNILLSGLSPMKLLRIISVDFDVTDQLLFTSFAFVRYWSRNVSPVRDTHQLFIDFKKAYDTVRREVLYNILIE
jgi:hypothetical protein